MSTLPLKTAHTRDARVNLQLHGLRIRKNYKVCWCKPWKEAAECKCETFAIPNEPTEAPKS